MSYKLISIYDNYLAVEAIIDRMFIDDNLSKLNILNLHLYYRTKLGSGKGAITPSTKIDIILSRYNRPDYNSLTIDNIVEATASIREVFLVCTTEEIVSYIRKGPSKYDLKMLKFINGPENTLLQEHLFERIITIMENRK